MNDERMLELEPIWNRMRSGWRRIAAFTFGAALFAAAIALLLPAWYRATASLLPPSEEESGFGIASLLKGIGVPGVKVPTTSTPADVFIAVLQSRRINEEIVRRFDLQKRYRKQMMEDALRELVRHASFAVNEAGMISVSVEDHDPARAADMANAYVEALDRFNRDVRMSKGRRTRMFVERRLEETKHELRAAEQRLAKYQEQHKTLALTPEMTSAIEAGARLYAERSAMQVRLGVVEGYSRGATDEAMQLRAQMAQIDRQLATIPSTGLEAARLLRDVKTLEALFVLLTGQYEESRITEARDVATVEVLDRATPPERRARPKRSLIVGIALAMGLVTGVAFVLMDPRSAGRAASNR